jgi:hypothetical protein
LANDALTPNAILHIEVQLPPISHDVPLKAIERWLRTPNLSPKEGWEAMAPVAACGGKVVPTVGQRG